MNDRIQGIILSTSDYKENDLILRVLSKEYGLLSLVAKGVKKITSKNKVLTMCLYEFTIDYKEGKTIFTMRHQKLLENFYEDQNLNLLAFKNLLLQVTLKVSEADDYNLFEDLLFTLSHVQKKDYYTAGCLYFCHLLKVLGIQPFVDGCVNCHDSKVVSISNEAGGFLCQKCSLVENYIDPIRLKKFRLLNKANFEHYDLVLAQGIDRQDFIHVVDFFIANSGINLKTYHFYLQLS